ncbi:unnamed protein product [Larinioides sclopetarius]|uniref:Uncharacterized protein n=1 Tax=Larinioides sclopetarius TaxID=280406 RepID=A0AAV1Z216_9ARAC
MKLKRILISKALFKTAYFDHRVQQVAAENRLAFETGRGKFHFNNISRSFAVLFLAGSFPSRSLQTD